MGARRWFAPVVVTAAVAGGGVAGAMIGVPALSGAQEAPAGAPDDGGVVADGPMQAAADALGMERSELVQELRDDKTIAQVAQEKGVDVNTVIDAMVAAAVENGRDEAKAREAITRFVNEGRPEVHHGRHPRLRHAAGVELEAAATALGMERSDLVQELRDGKTIADVAQEKGVDVDTVIDAMVVPARDRISRFVNEGRLDRD
jgi:hypothetical protein